MNSTNERIIIEVEKEKNEVIYVIGIYNRDISTLDRIKITYDELVNQIEEDGIIYYRAVKKYDHLGAKNLITGEAHFEYISKVEMTIDDLIKLPNRRCNFVEEYL